MPRPSVMPLKTLYIILRLLIIKCILQTGSFNRGPLKLYWFSAVYYCVSLEGYQAMCVRSFSFAKGQQAFRVIDKSAVYSSQDHPKLPKTLTFIFITTTQTAIFLATKHGKTIMACIYLFIFNISFIFNFWPAIP